VSKWHLAEIGYKLATRRLFLTCVQEKEKRRKSFYLRRFYISGQSRDRTGDLRIFSPSLYQLSYLSFAINLGQPLGAVNRS
jgi:hypothetical protein